MRIECTESVVVNTIIGSFIKQQQTLEKLVCTFCEYLIRELNNHKLDCTAFCTILESLVARGVVMGCWYAHLMTTPLAVPTSMGLQNSAKCSKV